MMPHYADDDGVYLGWHPTAPTGGVVVPAPPAVWFVWTGSAWVEGPDTPPPRYSKAALVESLTAEEAVAFEAALNSATPQLRLIWFGAPDDMNSGNAAWPTFEGLLRAGFGDARADAILTAAKL